MTKNNERDTHFAGFARLLGREIEAYVGTDADMIAIEICIAERAYDLALHVVEHQEFSRWEVPKDMSELLKDVPDLDAWPTKER